MSDPSYRWGGLGSLVASLQPRQCVDSEQPGGYSWAPPLPLDVKKGRENCELAITTLSLGISTIGRLMTRDDETNPLDRSEVGLLGELLASLGETLHELTQLEQSLSDQSRNEAKS